MSHTPSPHLPIALPPDRGETLQILSDRIRILADSAATGGACLVFESTSPPGGGPPLHRHTHDDEAFFIIEGTAKFSVNGKVFTLGPGGFALAPKGSIHTFTNSGSTPLRMLITCTPGGLEAPFRECHELCTQGLANPQTLAAAFAKFDLEFVGPPLTV